MGDGTSKVSKAAKGEKGPKRKNRQEARRKQIPPLRSPSARFGRDDTEAGSRQRAEAKPDRGPDFSGGKQGEQSAKGVNV